MEMGGDRIREIENFLEFNDNKYTAYPNSWSTLKVVVSQKFVALKAYIKNVQDGSHTKNLTSEHLKVLEFIIFGRSRWKEIIKFRVK